MDLAFRYTYRFSRGVELILYTFYSNLNLSIASTVRRRVPVWSVSGTALTYRNLIVIISNMQSADCDWSAIGQWSGNDLSKQ